MNKMLKHKREKGGRCHTFLAVPRDENKKNETILVFLECPAYKKKSQERASNIFKRLVPPQWKCMLTSHTSSSSSSSLLKW
mmetsp:Transcript_4654/g.6374  ORF Transcript_4654/g.6374 Transcript_4654/m.6374 type:complete len:81 (-) Transcript_4654:963-1205(-)